MRLLSHESLGAKPPTEIAEVFEPYTEFAQLAMTFETMGFESQAAYRAAYAVVAEDVADAQPRQVLRDFFLEDNGDQPAANSFQTLNGNTQRGYTPMVSPYRQARLNQTKYAASREPLVTFAARKALKAKVEFKLEYTTVEQAFAAGGILIQALQRTGPPVFSQTEVDLAVSALSQQLPDFYTARLKSVQEGRRRRR